MVQMDFLAVVFSDGNKGNIKLLIKVMALHNDKYELVGKFGPLLQ